MDITKIAFLLKEAAQEIKALKRENEELRNQLSNTNSSSSTSFDEKTASTDGLLGVALVEDDYNKKPMNSAEKIDYFFNN